MSASAASLALGDNYTALARGFNAMNWNPAGLGMPDNPFFSFAFTGRGAGGTGPISLGDLSRYSGVAVPQAVLASWLTRVHQQGGQSLEADGAGSFALSLGSFGFQLATNAYERGKLSPDAVEVLLYGNAGASGTPRSMSLKGSRTEAAVTTTAAASFGHAVDIGIGPISQHLAIGATVKYIVGNALLLGEDAGSQLDANPLALDVQFPIIQSDTSLNGMPQRGHGLGIDVGAAWQSGPLAIGASIQNLVNTFKWNVNEMYFRPGGALFTTSGTRQTNFDAMAMTAVPDSLRARASALGAEIDAMRFKPMLNVGASFHVLPFLTTTADVRQERVHQLFPQAAHIGGTETVDVRGECAPPSKPAQHLKDERRLADAAWAGEQDMLPVGEPVGDAADVRLASDEVGRRHRAADRKMRRRSGNPSERRRHRPNARRRG